jgi:hypothetical protein
MLGFGQGRVHRFTVRVVLVNLLNPGIRQPTAPREGSEVNPVNPGAEADAARAVRV